LDGLDADQVSIVSKLLQPKPTLRGSAAETLLHIQDLLPEGTSRKSGKTDYARRKPFSPGSMRGQSAKEILREAKREVKDEISKEVGEALAPVVAKATEKVREITAEKKDFKTALTLSTWWGWLGIDRLYLGKYGSGILKMLTGGGYGFWWYLDTKSILSGTAVDAYGRGLENQPEDLAAVRKRNAIKFISALVAVIGLLSLFSFLGNKSLSELHQVPSVSGMNLSVAKNALSNFNVVETDGTDQGRIVVDEANWKICSQTPTSGELNGRDPLTLRVVKLEENCP
jgi:TM2 domain-containing membrane protein YozV